MVSICRVCRDHGKSVIRSISTTVRKRHIGTQHAVDEDNYVTCCINCYKTICDEVNERWRELYREMLASCGD